MSQPKKVALVTGAAGILGPDICHVLQEAGWTVAASDRTLRDFEVTESYRGPTQAAAKFAADLSEEAACLKLIKDVESQLGSLSLVVNNAVRGSSKANVDALTAEELNGLFAVNVTAPFLLTQAALPSLEKNKGSVIMISSVMTQLIKTGFMSYAITKSALEKLVTYLAHELGPRGVRINTIRLGSFPGAAFMRKVLQSLEPEEAQELYDFLMPIHTEDDAGRVPLRGRGKELGELIAYVSSEKGRFIHGAILPLDGAYAIRQNEMGTSNRMEKVKEALNKWLIDHGKPPVDL